MNEIKQMIQILVAFSRLKAQLAAAREVIEQLDASTNKDEIDNAKSAAYEFLNEYPNA